MINLTVGLIGNNFAFKSLLEQRGLYCKNFPSIESGIKENIFLFACFDDAIKISELYNPSIILITTHTISGKIRKKTTFLKKGKFLFLNNKKLLAKKSGIYLNQYLSSFKNKKNLLFYKNHSEKYKITGFFESYYRNMLILSFPFNFLKLSIGDIGFSYQPHYSPYVKKYFVEVGPNVQWNQIGNYIFINLASIFLKKKIPFLYLDYKPNKKYFFFRIDADGFNQSTFYKTLSLINNNKIIAYWFIDVLGWFRNLKFIKLLYYHKQQIGIHSFRHVTYKKFFTNLVNLFIANFFIKLNSKIKPNDTAAVSPFGYYYLGYQKAINFFQYKFSSEFGYDINNLPSLPQNSSVLQIPCYPGSVGVYLDSKWTRDEIAKHLKNHVLNSLKKYNIILIYDHPDHIAQYDKEFKNVFSLIKSKNIVNKELGFYFKIWKARSLKKIIYKSHNIKLNTINNKFFNYKCIFNNSFFFRTNKNVYKQNLVNLDKLELQPLPSKLIWSICEKKNINISKEVNNSLILFFFRTIYTLFNNYLRFSSYKDYNKNL
jgi:hypothetical protein